jgi:TRAP-type C4-dicarboxylate transport system permease small subunit
MAEHSETARPTDPAGRLLFSIARILALLGGLLCCAMAAIVTVSVAGRYLLSSPIPGDYDIVGILSGCAIFAFLPYCQLVRGNIIVDFFTTKASPRFRTTLDAIGTLIYLAAMVMFAWRLFAGMQEFQHSGEVIAAYNFYRWWTLPFELACAIVLILVIAYTFTRDFADLKTGRATTHEAVRGD